MSLPTIDFKEIRTLDGSQHAGFEEICTQLAALDPADPEAIFVRKGSGGDGGVECFRQNPGGSETGWQAKYVFQWDDSLASQLGDSIETALEKHPHLAEYIVCLPFDLPDARSGRGKTAREKWEDWKARRIKGAQKRKFPLSITLWGRTELIARLTRDASQFGGRMLYWFNKEGFTPAWFREQLEKTKGALGSRYTPESNIELPIRQDFLALSRDESLQRTIDTWFIQISDRGRSAVNAINKLPVPEASSKATALQGTVDGIAKGLGREPVALDKSYPVTEWEAAAALCKRTAAELVTWLYTLSAPEGTRGSDADPFSQARHAVRQLLEAVSDIREDLSGQRWKMANQRAILLTGKAGTGKSHLLADIVEYEVQLNRPALMFLGSSLRDEEPWRQLLGELDRPATEQVKHFLGALDAAAETAGVRAIVCIDALNERNGIHIWPHRLAVFLKVAASFSRIVVVVSCRTTYLPYVIPSDLGPDVLYRVNHAGFAGDAGRTAALYLDKRGIVRPGAPSLLPEFNNPLFLKTCCDFLEKEGRRELPRGLRGVTSIFSFYNEAVARAINQRMRLDSNYEIVPRAILGFADQLVKSGRGYLEKAASIAFFEGLHPSQGVHEKSLFSQLVAEGVLSVEPISQNDGSFVEYVRFTFERFSDHAIASHLLDTHLKDGDVAGSFASGTPLYDLICGDDNYEYAGIIDAMAIQLPERTGIELIDACTQEEWILPQAFFSSLLWRKQEYFTHRTFEIAKERLDEEPLNDLILSVSTEPENKFNARYLHSLLKKVPMPERDATWSTYLGDKGYCGEIETIISWSIQNGFAYIEDERAYLAALILTWFFTASHRSIRDRATKALASLLASRLTLGATLLGEFNDIDDPYVLERLLAACYGAALQGQTRGLGELAKTIYRLQFQRGKPIVDALARDHALGVIEYAHWRGVLPPDVDLQACRPPYQSRWPIEYVPDELIETYVETLARGTFQDDIVGSTVNDGDFARYQMDYKVDDWSPAPRHTPELPSAERIFDEWFAEFRAWGSRKQKATFKVLLNAYDAARGIHDNQRTPEILELDALREKFQAALSSDQWEDFRVRAEDFLRFERGQEWRSDRPAPFNRAWARRWVCKRAHDLGWTSERFTNFDRTHYSRERTDHEVERIGKKYQWIAFRELLARMADNLACIGEHWPQDGKSVPYPGARQAGFRDLDPSLLISATYYDGWADSRRTWWVPVQVNLRPMEANERLAWLDSDTDLINGVSLIDLTDGKTGRRWLSLSSLVHARGHGLHDGHKEYQRETWAALRSVIVRQADLMAFVHGLQNTTLTDPHSLAHAQLDHSFYLGEYPWHPDLSDVDPWMETGRRQVQGVLVRPTTASYSCERGGYDYSIDRTVSVEIPAPWLAVSMGLHMANGHHPVYKDANGHVLFFDPSVDQPGSAAALVDRDAFLRMLQREELAAVWVIAGEKSVYGGRDIGSGFGGRLTHTTIYWFDGQWKQSQTHKVSQKPSTEQLAALLSTDVAPKDGMPSPAAPPATAASRRRSTSKSAKKTKTKKP
jgi:hypothetical protein